MTPRMSPRICALVGAALAASCGPRAREVIDAAHQAIARGDVEAAEAHIAAEYRDPLGDRALLLSELRGLAAAFGRVELRASELSLQQGATRREVHATGRLDVELTSNPTVWRYTGPLELALRDDGAPKIESGLLSDLRDVMALMRARRAALEANDPDAYVALLHPTYADGDLDLEDARARLRAELPGHRLRLEPTLYRIEGRGLITHVDEHYVLQVGEERLPPAIARLTLRRAAGLWRISAGLYASP